MVREYKTFEQQIEILKNRNLIINDESMAKEILTIHNYYKSRRPSGLRKTMS